ncbi:MAG: threonylcarbamoyl-AMP synthase [Lachnospiraceae bacterium]|nr:threonylcarbamoyl-AMP synthase [Lachnospiraceae bacterium]
MNTEYIRVDNNKSCNEYIKRAGEIIRQGGLVAFPTETVYGLGGDALNRASARKIYEAKGRPSDNPLIVHIASLDDLPRIAESVPESACRLAERFWPGPLTMIFKKKDTVPEETTGGLKTVAVRMPGHETALSFIRAAGGFVAAPSANRSGRPSPTTGERVLEDMNGRIEMILDGGPSQIGLESTILDLSGCSTGNGADEPPMILRPGYVTEEMLREVIGGVRYDRTVFEKADAGLRPKAPGMKYRHYAPFGTLRIVKGDRDAVISYIREAAQEARAAGKRVGILACDTEDKGYEADLVLRIGSLSDEAEIARSLYESFRTCDDQKIDLIYSEEFMTKRLGHAIMNRLLKAAGHEVIEV